MFDVIRHIFTIPLQNQRNSKGEKQVATLCAMGTNFLLIHMFHQQKEKLDNCGIYVIYCIVSKLQDNSPGGIVGV